MKSIKFTILILVIFLKTGNVLSEKNLFNVNNIEVIKESKVNNEILANKAIKKGFNELIERILLTNDAERLKKLSFSEIKDLVSYYQIITEKNKVENLKMFFNISFDKEKLHNLFFKNEVSYSDIINEELYLLPILKKENKLFIYTQNYFYDNWNEVGENKLIEFILPLENIETIQKINSNQNNLLDIDIRNIFLEYTKKNLVLVFIEDTKSDEEKVFLKTIIMGKRINKIIVLKRSGLSQKQFNEKIILDIKKEIINLVKLQNLIDIRTPSFINATLNVTKKNSLKELNSRLKKIDLIENIYIQELNNEYILIKIKYLGKIKKIIDQLESQKIILKLTDDQWVMKLI